MIKIIKEGKNPPLYLQTCKRCECEFSGEEDDVIDDACSQSYFKCPTCDNHVDAELHPFWKY